MSYEVVLTDGAKRQLDEACAWYVENAPRIADRWYGGFISALAELEEHPDRFSLARENGSVSVEIRQLHYGAGKRKTHRAIFSIHKNRVIVRSIRHLARRDVTDGDL